MFKQTLGIGLAALLSAGLVGHAAAGNPAADKGITVTNDLSAATKKTTVKRTTTVRRGGKTAVKSTTVRRSTTVHRNTTVRRNVVVVRRPYRAWAHRPYYGTAIIGGVALGTIIAVSAAHTYPAPPGPNACWYWSDPSETHGYWDYCTPP